MKYAILILLAVSLTSCATIVSSGPDAVPCDSDPRGATVFLDRQPVGKTPCQVMVPKMWGTGELTFVLDGKVITVWPARTVNPWVFGNIIIGGAVGVVIDVATGNCRMSLGTPIYVDFTSMSQVIP